MDTVDRRRSIEAVVFDLGGVLIDWDPRYVFRTILPDEASVEDFLATVCTPAWNAHHDAGLPFAQGVAELSDRHPEQAALIRAYADRWADMLAGPIDGTVEILEELHAGGVRLFALTNWSAETFPVARDRFPFLQRFEGIVVSGEERVIKPQPEIYRILLERYALDPATCLFVDDAEANLRTAEALGFVAQPFTSPAGLRDRLVALDLLTAR
jgi:2-haloacid dehalogenase